MVEASFLRALFMDAAPINQRLFHIRYVAQCLHPALSLTWPVPASDGDEFADLEARIDALILAAAGMDTDVV